jgi:hypothetical protein
MNMLGVADSELQPPSQSVQLSLDVGELARLPQLKVGKLMSLIAE